MATPRSTMVLGTGPFKARDLPSGSNYELDNGHPVYCAPTGSRGGSAQALGAQVIRTDPLVKHAGVEVGFQLDDGTLRAPDVAVLASAPHPGWELTAPPLAIEYADHGQDEPELEAKITQLLAAGTQAVWVVRLGRLRHVEVYTRAPDDTIGKRVAHAGESLALPGVLQNPVPVAALFDPDVADLATLDNLLDRFGFVHPDRAREEGRQEGREEGREEGRLAALRTAAALVLSREGAPVPDLAALGEQALLDLIARR